MLPIYFAPWLGTVEAFVPAAAGCLMGVFILAAFLLWTSGLGGTSGFLGRDFALVLLAAGFFAPAPLNSSVSRAVASASGVGTSVTGEAGAGLAVGVGTGLGAGDALGTCGAVASVGVGGVVGFVGSFSFSTEGDFLFRNSGLGGSSGFLVGLGVAGGVLGFGDAREGIVFGGEGAFLAGVGVVVLGNVFSGDFEGVCDLAVAAGVGAGCGFVFAGDPLVFGGEAVFF